MDGLGIIPGHPITDGEHVSQVILGHGMPLFGGCAEPARGFSLVSRRFLIIEVHGAETVLRCGMALPGGLAQPADGFAGIPGHPFPLRKFVSQVVLRGCVPLFGREAIPAHSFGVILSHALAVVVAAAEQKLRPGIALLRDPGQFLGVRGGERQAGGQQQARQQGR